MEPAPERFSGFIGSSLRANQLRADPSIIVGACGVPKVGGVADLHLWSRHVSPLTGTRHPPLPPLSSRLFARWLSPDEPLQQALQQAWQRMRSLFLALGERTLPLSELDGLVHDLLGDDELALLGRCAWDEKRWSLAQSAGLVNKVRWGVEWVRSAQGSVIMGPG